MAEEAERVSIDFCTLGMFIIDEIHFEPPIPPAVNVLGGAGSYSALGARLFAVPPKSKCVGWVVDIGSDFPSDIRNTIESWNTNCTFRDNPARVTTRGWNEYGADEHRAFRYVTPKLRLDEKALDPQLLMSKSFHLICSPVRCVELVNGIMQRRRHLRDSDLRPLFIWEPVPDLCLPQNLEDCYRALRSVDIVSPNHHELCQFFEGNDAPKSDSNISSIAKYANIWLDNGIGHHGQGAVVVRAGKEGCYIAMGGYSKWTPAYHGSPGHKVVDPTGGGNAFLGGLAMGLVNAGARPGVQNLEEAAKWGTIAASFAIEQVGLPKLEYGPLGELWNGESVLARLQVFHERCMKYKQPQI